LDVFERLVGARDPKTSLLTASNHVSMFDDPGLNGVLPLRTLMQTDKVRWTMAAEEVIFLNRLTQWFFTQGRILPTVRGAGIYQPCVADAIARLDAGQWLHIYPEAGIHQYPQMLPRWKWGVGRLLLETKNPPLFLPYWHVGMETVVPND
ncbi:hypothetical protein CXG81DRAFT_1340, partial [Caulochytrium protostelioides]